MVLLRPLCDILSTCPYVDDIINTFASHCPLGDFNVSMIKEFYMIDLGFIYHFLV